MNTLKLRTRCLVALTALAITPLTALAAGSATINYSGEIGQFSWQNAQTARMEMSANAGSYTLLKDNKVYMVHTNATQGMPQVMEMGDLLQTFSDLAKQDDNVLHELGQDIQSVRKLGNETVAGIKGELYEITVKNGKGSAEVRQLVLTDDPAVLELTEAFFGLSGTLGGADYLQQFKQALPKGMYGLLRIDDSMVVQSIQRTAPAADTFNLPAEPVSFGGMMKRLMEQATQQ